MLERHRSTGAYLCEEIIDDNRLMPSTNGAVAFTNRISSV